MRAGCNIIARASHMVAARCKFLFVLLHRTCDLPVLRIDSLLRSKFRLSECLFYGDCDHCVGQVAAASLCNYYAHVLRRYKVSYLNTYERLQSNPHEQLIEKMCLVVNTPFV